MKLNRVVVATDFSEPSWNALEVTLSLSFEPNATLYLVHVLEFVAVEELIVGVPVDELYSRFTERLEALVLREQAPELIVKTAVLTGRPATVIARFAREEDADLIVIGTHGRRGLSRLLMGSTAESLLRLSPCQVLVVKAKLAMTPTLEQVPGNRLEDVTGSTTSFLARGGNLGLRLLGHLATFMGVVTTLGGQPDRSDAICRTAESAPKGQAC